VEEKIKYSSEICELLLSLQFFCEATDDKKFNKQVDSIKFKILFLIFKYKNVSPSVICKRLNMAKSNVALFCKKFINEGLVESNHDEEDKRIIYYCLTQKGKDFVIKLLFSFDKFLIEKYKERDLKNIIDKSEDIISLLKIGDR